MTDAAHTELLEFCAEFGDEEVLMADGFDHCVIGLAERFSSGPTLCYDLDQVLATLVAGGLTPDEALEHYQYNIVGAWVGDRTPIFLLRRYAPQQQQPPAGGLS